MSIKSLIDIEYSWGVSKQKLRREINDEVPKHLHRNMVASMCTDTILTVQRVRRFARRTRDYCRAYLALEKGGDIESKDMIEKIRINAKRTATSLTWNLASSTSSSALGPPAGHS